MRRRCGVIEMVSQKTKPEIVYEFLESKNGVGLKKIQIMKATGLSKCAVDRCCTILRKMGKIGIASWSMWKSPVTGKRISSIYWAAKEVRK